MKKMNLMLITLSALLLSACGGGNGSSDPMNNKNFVSILQNVETGICESALFSNGLSELGLEDFLLRETENTTTCDTYGKVNNGVECTVEVIGTGNRNCVLGFNEIPAEFNGALARQVSPVLLDNTVDLITATFE